MLDILNGVRVIDLSSVIAGPFATQMLGDLGADVIKVERPGGDTVRQTGKGRRAGMSGMFLNNNRNKRSICLDVKTPSGREAMLRLIAGCDVCIHNIRPAAMKRLGLDWPALKNANPRLIHVNIVGYGQDGPYAAFPAYDDMIQAAVGLPALVKQAGASAPRYIPIVIADRTASYVAVNAVLAALIKRERDGVAQNIEVPMFEAMAQMVLADHLSGRTFVPPISDAGYERLMSSRRQPFQTSDGVICALIYNDTNWRDFLAMNGRGDLFERDPRFASMSARTQHIDELYALAAEIFLTRTSAEWLTLLEKADIPVMPFIGLDELCDDRHLWESESLRTEQHPTEGPILSVANPIRWREGGEETPGRHAPMLGEQGQEILEQFGFSPSEIATLVGHRTVRLDVATALSAMTGPF